VPNTSEKRHAIVEELTDHLAGARNPVARGDLLIRIGRLYTDDTLGPPSPLEAIRVFESILSDPTMDVYSQAQAHSWIASKYIEIGRSEWPKAIRQMEILLALDGKGLDPQRLEGLKAEQICGFKTLLALMETGHPKSDETLWRSAFEKYGASEEFKQQLDALVVEQKRQLSSEYFNN
jgi:hypothetical protein